MKKNTIQNEMCLMLNCTHERYSWVLYKYGIAYLQWYLPVDARQRRKLESSSLYWKWFRQMWEQLDAHLLNDADFFDKSIKERRLYYQAYHNPHDMVQVVKPNDVVLSVLNEKEVCV